MSDYEKLLAMRIQKLEREISHLKALEAAGIDLSDYAKLADLSDYVDKTTNQTVGGVKTFTSIPVLPASDPVSDEQAVRKKYVDALTTVVAIKYVELTSTVAQAVNRNTEFDIPSLSITHSLSKSTNKLLLLAQIGEFANSAGNAQGGVGFAVDNTFIFIGDADGTRVRVSQGARPNSTDSNIVSVPLNLSTVYSPDTTNSKTYTVRAKQFQHSSGDSKVIYINRSERDDGRVDRRTASSLILIEFGEK